MKINNVISELTDREREMIRQRKAERMAQKQRGKPSVSSRPISKSKNNKTSSNTVNDTMSYKFTDVKMGSIILTKAGDYIFWEGNSVEASTNHRDGTRSYHGAVLGAIKDRILDDKGNGVLVMRQSVNSENIQDAYPPGSKEWYELVSPHTEWFKKIVWWLHDED